jgi:ribonuclease III family protein
MTKPAVAGDLRALSPGALAYVGDAVYELHARLDALGDGKGLSGAMHRRAVKVVKATTQAEVARRLLPELTEAEAAIFRRGRNNTSGSMPKHADPVAYRAATGIEAVIGYLFLKGDETRVEALMEKACAIAKDLESHPAQPDRRSGPEAGEEESNQPDDPGETVTE